MDPRTLIRGIAWSAAATLVVAAGAVAKDRDPSRTPSPSLPPPPPVLDVPPDGTVMLTLAGQPVKVFAAPGMPSRLYLSRDRAVGLLGQDAARFANDDGGFKLFSVGRATGAKVGPVRVKGNAEMVALGDGKPKRQIGVSWFETDAYPFGEALAGPYALPDPVVRFRLHTPRPEETRFSLPLASRYRWWIATTTQTIGGHRIAFALAPHFPRTVASAAAGAAIARELGGRFAGPAAPVSISHGIQRPARPIELARPLAFGPISIDRLLVRTADYGSTAGIAADPSEVADTDAIVVKGRRRSDPSYVVYLGADLLGGCSSITYDKPAARIDLSCLPPPAA